MSLGEFVIRCSYTGSSNFNELFLGFISLCRTALY